MITGYNNSKYFKMAWFESETNTITAIFQNLNNFDCKKIAFIATLKGYKLKIYTNNAKIVNINGYFGDFDKDMMSHIVYVDLIRQLHNGFLPSYIVDHLNND